MISSRTGSGKTLSYLIPMIEKLYRQKWCSLDGLGALVIVPVRELAIQVFEVLRSFAHLHEMSAGMIIGGKQVDIEKSRIASMNILVATPGRLVQHMNETPLFDCDNLQMLVLDEVDRILDMGFSDDLKQIMNFLPRRKIQTLLFSATAKNSLRKYARQVLNSDFLYFCMNNYDSSNNIITGEKAEGEELKAAQNNDGSEITPKYVTPVKLTHKYMVVDAENKLDTLFSFIKSHKEAKCIVFFSS
jgi:ATP-dependent RNA helicase DDX10/DBP4